MRSNGEEKQQSENGNIIKAAIQLSTSQLEKLRAALLGEKSEIVEREFENPGTIQIPVDAIQIATSLLDVGENEKEIRLKISSGGEILRFKKEEIIVGRRADCDLVVQNRQVSGVHMKIRRMSGDRYDIVDMLSSNGTVYYEVNDNNEKELKDHVVTVMCGCRIVLAGQVMIELL